MQCSGLLRGSSLLYNVDDLETSAAGHKGEISTLREGSVAGKWKQLQTIKGKSMYDESKDVEVELKSLGNCFLD